ncbi:MAG: hypothetical protein ACRDPM_22365 [Solirubrobacteraceae bacterium]
MDGVDRGVLVKIVGEQEIAPSLDVCDTFGIERWDACRVELSSGGDVQQQALGQQVVVIEPPRTFQAVPSRGIPSFQSTSEPPGHSEQHLRPGEQDLVIELAREPDGLVAEVLRGP